jgi:peptide/nickel transport system permease protein
MVTLLLKRLGAVVIVMLLISFATYTMLYFTPGDAAEMMVGESATEAQLAELRHQLGLDRSLIERYLQFAGAAFFHGDLGESLTYGRPVTQLLASAFPGTFRLSMLAMLLALIFGMGAGWMAAAHPYGKLDGLVMSLASLGLALPNYWLALLLIAFFSVFLGWLPVIGAGSSTHFILPSICLALPIGAGLARMTRASLLDVVGQDFVCTAHGKGLPVRRIWRDHIWRNALMPVLTMIGLNMGRLLTGTFIIETIFGWPGLGRMVTQAIFNRDYPLIVGAVLLFALIYQMLNLLVDFLHVYLDPRIEQGLI